LWAAWGDALGFPAELADERMFQRRLDGPPDGQLRSWPRRIGGRMGPTVELPAGCYSDDTQLRLAVSRCVRSSGRFDVEAFSKIELRVFLSYELGAGRGTKAAAHALGRRGTRWFSNFFDARGSRYIDGGGNGAAMRVQPHVWAAHDAKPETYLVPLLRDVVCTHGHPRGILGAAFHALALAAALHQHAVPGPERWAGIVEYLPRVSALVEADENLAERWLPVWQDAAGRPFSDVVDETVAELHEQIGVAARSAQRFENGDAQHAYRKLATELGGLKPASRGAGTVSAVLALWLAWCLQDRPAEALRLPAELLGSDTDTVASMAGALAGAVASNDPPGDLLDRELIIAEANRLEALRHLVQRPSFPHPDPLRWQPPSALSDALGLIDDRPAVAGLGPVREQSKIISGQGKNPGLWQWVRSDYGQTMLVKRRQELGPLPPSAQPRARPNALPPAQTAALTAPRPDAGTSERADPLPEDPEAGVALLVEHGFDSALTARLLGHYGRQGATAAAVFATLFSTKLRDREGRAPTSNGTSESR
jgi:ADP-ribosylglycohydrolase